MSEEKIKTKKSININHSTSSILSSNGSCIELSKNGVVKIGKGINAQGDNIDNSNPDLMKEYEGALRFNQHTKKMEYCDGTKWVELSLKDDDTHTSMVYSVLF
jgi:hypothetical protein